MNIGAAGYGNLSQWLSIASASVSNGSAGKATAKPDGARDATVEVSVGISVTAVAATSEPRTVADVKKEFYDYLDSLPLSPGLSNTSISVNVTEAAFERMLTDPDYMQRMKDVCARDLCDGNWTAVPPTGINIVIDAATHGGEEYLGSSWGSAYSRSNANPDGFWTRRTVGGSSDRKAQEKRAQEKRDLMEALQARAAERRQQARELMTSIATGRGVAAYASTQSLGAAATVGGLFG